MQVDPLPQLSEHEPEQVTLQVAFSQLTLPLVPMSKLQVDWAVQLRLLLWPAVSSQVDPPLQPPLHEAPQVSLEQVPLGQVMSQLFPLQLVWVQPLDPPQARSATARRGSNDFNAFTGSPCFARPPAAARLKQGERNMKTARPQRGGQDTHGPFTHRERVGLQVSPGPPFTRAGWPTSARPSRRLLNVVRDFRCARRPRCLAAPRRDR